MDKVTKQWKVTILDELKRKRHVIFFPNKEIMINSVIVKAPELSKDALGFIKEFQNIMKLDRDNKRIKILKIINRHYKEIYSCFTNKFITLRSLHFLLSL